MVASVSCHGKKATKRDYIPDKERAKRAFSAKRKVPFSCCFNSLGTGTPGGRDIPLHTAFTLYRTLNLEKNTALSRGELISFIVREFEVDFTNQRRPSTSQHATCLRHNTSAEESPDENRIYPSPQHKRRPLRRRAKHVPATAIVKDFHIRLAPFLSHIACSEYTRLCESTAWAAQISCRTVIMPLQIEPN